MTYSQLRRRVRRFLKAYQSMPVESFKLYLKGLTKILGYKTDNFDKLVEKLVMSFRNQTFLTIANGYLYLRSLNGPLHFPSENNLVLKFELEFVVKSKKGVVKPFKNPDGSFSFLYLSKNPCFLIPLPSFNKEHPYYYKEGSKIILSNHNCNSRLNLCYLVKNRQILNRILQSLKELDPNFRWNSSERMWISE